MADTAAHLVDQVQPRSRVTAPTGAPTFVPVDPPSDADIQQLVERTAEERLEHLCR